MKFLIFVHNVSNQIQVIDKNPEDHNFCCGKQRRCENKNYEIHDFCSGQNLIRKSRSGQAHFLSPALQQSTKSMRFVIFVPVHYKEKNRSEQK